VLLDTISHTASTCEHCLSPTTLSQWQVNVYRLKLIQYHYSIRTHKPPRQQTYKWSTHWYKINVDVLQTAAREWEWHGPHRFHGNSDETETDSVGLPLEYQRNSEMKTHFTVMLLLLNLQWQKRICRQLFRAQFSWQCKMIRVCCSQGSQIKYSVCPCLVRCHLEHPTNDTKKDRQFRYNNNNKNNRISVLPFETISKSFYF